MRSVIGLVIRVFGSWTWTVNGSGTPPKGLSLFGRHSNTTFPTASARPSARTVVGSILAKHSIAPPATSDHVCAVLLDPNSNATARQLIFKNFMFSSSSRLIAHSKDALRIG